MNDIVEKCQLNEDRLIKINEEKVEVLENDNLILIEKIENLDSLLNQNKEQIVNYEEVIKTLQTELSEIKELAQIRRSTSFNYSICNNSFIGLNSSIQVPEIGESVADMKINTLENENKHLIQEKEELEKKLLNLEIEKTNLKKSLDEVQNILNENNKIRLVENEGFKELYDKLRLEIEQLMSKTNNKFELISDILSNKKFKFLQKSEMFKALIIKNNSLIHSLKNKNNELRKKLVNLQKLYDEKSSQFMYLKNLNEELARIKDSHITLKNDYIHYSNELEQTFGTSCEQIKAELQKQYDILSILSHFKHSLEAKLDEQTIKNKQIMEELLNSKSVIENLTKTVENQNEKISDYKILIEKASNQKIQLDTEFGLLKLELENLKKVPPTNADVFEKEIIGLKNEIKKYQIKIKKLTQELNIEKQSFEMERKTKERLLKDISKLEMEMNNNTNKRKLPQGTGSQFEMAEEEGQFMNPTDIAGKISNHLKTSKASPFPNKRIKTLIERNSRVKPHLRTAYPLELQNVPLDEKALRSGNLENENIEKIIINK